MKRIAGFLVLAALCFARFWPSPCRAGFPDWIVSPSSQTNNPQPSGSGTSYYSGYWSTSSGKASESEAMTPPKGPKTNLQPILPSPPTAAGSSQPGGVRPASHVQPELVPSPVRDPTPPVGNGAGAGARPGAGRSEGDPAAMRGEVNLKPAPLETTDLAFPINLPTALRLAEARPLIVNAAQASAWVAEAQLQRAKVLWVPTFNSGGDYIRHDGPGPDFNLGLNTNARPLSQNVNFLYAGIGITQDVAMSEAIFQPLITRQVLNSRRWDIQTAKNDALLATTNTYFSVHQYRGQYAGAIDVINRGQKLVERLRFLSADLIPKVEVDRAVKMLADMQQHTALARQNWRVSSADLTQILRLDPRVMVVPQEHDHLQITLINPDRPLDELIPIGLTNRPELASQQALVRSVAQTIRQEKGRLLMPSLMLNGFQTPQELLQMGAQGFGAGSKLDLWGLRDDVSPQVLWQYEGMGLGNMARIKEQRGNESLSIIEQFKIQDAVAADVTRAQARLQSAAVRVVQAERSMREALITFEGNYEGLAQTKRFGNVLVQVYRPQEAVIALEHLLVAYDQYFATVAEYNRAQFELFHALGYPAQEVAALNPPGEVLPVNTERPTFLPPVGVGPPPATR